MKITNWDETGKIIGYQILGGEPSQPYIEADIPEGEAQNYKVVDGKLVPKNQSDLDADALEKLERLKPELRAGIKDHREELLEKGCLYKGEHFQSDLLSRANLNDMVESADFLTFPFEWISWDNISVPLDSKVELIALATTMKQFIAMVFQGSFTAETALSNATTEEESRAIVETYKES